MTLLYSQATPSDLSLQNRLVIYLLTRNRATSDIPRELIADYQVQPSSIGLIIAQATSPNHRARHL